MSTREIDTLLRHPVALDLEGILQRGEVLIVAGAKATVGEDNTVLITQLLLQLLHRAIQAQHNLPPQRRRRVALLIDEAHNVLTASVARMLAEGRSAGLEAVLAWQYSAQIRDEVIRSGVRSLLQSLSIFRMREMEDARSLAGLAMEVYSDRISIDQAEQERLRFSPDDIVKLPIHRAINLWVADGVPRAGFLAHTLAMEDLHDEALAAHHTRVQRERGGRHPGHLPNPLAAQADNDDTPAPPRRASSSRSGTAKRRPGGKGAGATLQLPLDAPDVAHDPQA
ncbi:MAG: type IV secretion system DNA-binding domain-containing protein [Solirubrobacteraceae bacterium]